ncbi:MAG: hypothetical protein ACI9LY_004023 [Arenicella sp.]|jgi:hypothetical protein
MFSFLKKDPLVKLNRQYSTLLEQALGAQRRGDIRLYSQLTSQAEDVASSIDSIKLNAKTRA